MPSNEEVGSEPQQESRARNSVFDFLYHDVPRISSFLAQFETYGVLQQIKASESVGHSGTSKTVITGDLGVPLVAKGAVALDGTVVDEQRDAAERTYDPLLRNARTLMNYLAEREMVHDLMNARIGQFVLATGQLAAFDLALLREAWKLPAVRKVILQEATKSNQGKNAKEREQERLSTDGAFEMLKIMPHAIQATIRGEGWSVWATLRETSLAISASDLLLKHGVGISGQWSMLGVLDAAPNSDVDGSNEQSMLYILDQLLGAASLGGIAGQAVGQLAPAVRMMLGRPADAFGMTPLLIFREVSG